MGKKLILACMAVVALAAFALPATAMAGHPRLCETTSGVCTDTEELVGKKIRGHLVAGEVSKFTDASGNTLVECSEATLTGTLTENSATAVKGDIESASFTGAGGGACGGLIGATTVHTNIGNGVPWCLKSEGAAGEKNEFSVFGGACTLKEPRSITFVLTTPIGTCKYSRTAAITGGTFTTHTSPSEDAILTLTGGTSNEFTKEEGSGLCPGSGRLDMKITLTTDDSPTFTTLYIENV